MKKILCFVLSLMVLALSFSACSKNTVEIVYPSYLFGEQDMSSFDGKAYCEKNDFLSATANNDGTITVKMTEKRYQKLVTETTKELEDGFAELINGASTPYIKKITHNQDFSEVTVEVVRAEYPSVLDPGIWAIDLSVQAAQISLGYTVSVKISVVDTDTGEVIFTNASQE